MQKSPVFRWKTQIRFHQADPAGWLFFGRAFEIAHDCCEDLLTHLGVSWRDWFRNSQHAMPIRQAEADYRRPLAAGSRVEIEARILRLGDSSVTFGFDFFQDGQLCLLVRSTHVHLNTETQRSEPWPSSFRTRLETFTSANEEPQT